jgi:hypothetical protein
VILIVACLREATIMQFYRVYNMDPSGQTLGFKGFPAPNDHDACILARTYKESGKWHEMELWTGNDKIECSDLIDPRPLGRKIEISAAKLLSH